MTPQFTRQVKAVLFDLDDTLFDHQYAARCVLQDLQARHPSLNAYSLEFLEREDYRLLAEKHSEILAGSLGLDDARIQRIQSLFACCGEEITLAYARELAILRQTIYRAQRRAVPGAIALLEALRPHVKVGIVTNHFTAEQQDKMVTCGLTPFVDVLVTSEDAKHAKPAREIFDTALERLGCIADEAVMVGDSLEGDIIGARNAGIRAIWFNRHERPKPDDLDVVQITSLEPADVIAALIRFPEVSVPDPR